MVGDEAATALGTTGVTSAKESRADRGKALHSEHLMGAQSRRSPVCVILCYFGRSVSAETGKNLVCLFYLHERQRDRDGWRQRQRERKRLSNGLLPKRLPKLGLGQVEAGNQKLSLSLPRGWQGLST